MSSEYWTPGLPSCACLTVCQAQKLVCDEKSCVPGVLVNYIREWLFRTEMKGEFLWALGSYLNTAETYI